MKKASVWAKCPSVSRSGRYFFTREIAGVRFWVTQNWTNNLWALDGGQIPRPIPFANARLAKRWADTKMPLT
jgi:hypothetical protein